MGEARVTRAPLTHSQAEMWRDTLETPVEYAHLWNLVRPVSLPDGVGLDEIASALHLMVSRHQSLRTTVDVGDDGESVQVIHPPAGVDFVVREVPAVADDVLDEQIAAATAQHIDIRRALPCRATVLTVQDSPRHLLLVVHHMAATLRTLAVAVDDFLRHLSSIRGDVEWDGLPVPMQPVDRATRERSVAGLRIAERCARQRLDTLLRLPNTSFPYFREPVRGARTVAVHMWSRALAVALQEVRRRLGVSGAAVLFGACNVLIGAFTGHRLGWEMILDKGPLSRARPLVEFNVANAHVIFDPAGRASVVDVVRAVWTECMVALRHAHYDPHLVLEGRADVYRRRNTRVQPELCFNYAVESMDPDGAGGPPSGSARALLSDTRLYPRDEGPPIGYVAVMVRPAFEQRGRSVADSGIDLNLVGVSVTADTTLIPTADINRILLGVEQLVCRLAEQDDIPLSAVAAAVQEHDWPRQPDWARLSGDRWVDLEATGRLLRGHPQIVDGRLTVDDPGGVLVAHVRTRGPHPDASQLREYCLSRLDEPGVVVPDQFVCSADSGTGPPEPSPGAEPMAAVDVLVEAIARANRLSAVDPALDYVAAGGRARFVPAIQRRLLVLGWQGLRSDDLFSPKPIRQVAAGLDRIAVEAAT
ncbi:condensation domain-containing protein [Micromonospora okii]|uniref:condensation domain-containing protein n=1 Tax=Micromonospora okii TaxID=1182970 RepID=UPI001E566D5F|nr:condensation domain-containing protein [Micromonospora okii]